MNGAIEEGGRVASSLIESLKQQPVTLAMVVFNVVFLIVIYLAVERNRERDERFETRLFEQQDKFAEMLYRCTPNAAPRKEQEP